MAGAGFKTFNTGDVLTASDVNTYLMQQTVMVFADSSARSTALGANVAEGMLSYLKDTDVVEVYNGSAWVSSDDPNAIQNTIVAAKGDIIGASANDTPAVTSVGANGYTLVADSSTSTGLAYSPTFFAGKNKIINGDFGIWQRGTSFTTGNGAYVYTADRWRTYFYGSNTTSVTQQSFTAGTAPVSGYEGTYFLRGSSSNTQLVLEQLIEDVRTFANQTVTVSFWVKQNTANANSMAVSLVQNFGSGGSATVTTGVGSGLATTTGWVRYSGNVTVPSVSGKTIGAGSYLAFQIVSTSLNNALDIWGVQVEAGSTATQFQTATGNLASELAACQRYYYREANSDVYSVYVLGTATQTNTVDYVFRLPVRMRVTPTSIEYANIGSGDGANAMITSGSFAIPSSTNSTDSPMIRHTASGFTQYRPYTLTNNNSSTGYLAFVAEL